MSIQLCTFSGLTCWLSIARRPRNLHYRSIALWRILLDRRRLLIGHLCYKHHATHGLVNQVRGGSSQRSTFCDSSTLQNLALRTRMFVEYEPWISKCLSKFLCSPRLCATSCGRVWCSATSLKAQCISCLY